MSRNNIDGRNDQVTEVAPREGRVSRNDGEKVDDVLSAGRAPRGACE